MAMGRRETHQQGELWVATTKIPESPGHPFYQKLGKILLDNGFDAYVEGECSRFYREGEGRPGIPPGVYFRMLLIGYFEGLDSERGIAWRCEDSLSLKQFLGYQLTDSTPDHSSLSVIRRRLDVETHTKVFQRILELIQTHGLLKGKTVGVDGTTLEANAAMKSIVRRDTGESYDEFLTKLAKANGIETPTREQLAKLDRKRKKKGSNDDWKNPHDPDAKITKMKDGRTHLAHKSEHAVDMETGAVIAVTIQPANRGDTKSLEPTLEAARENLVAITQVEQPTTIEELVTDKGYHSNDVVVSLEQQEVRSYVSEPDRGRRNWEDKQAEQKAVYANRRRVRGRRGKRLMRRRGEILERTFAHCYETGRLRRTYLRGHENILKRVLIHVGAFNLGLVMRKMTGRGTPRGLGELGRVVFALFRGLYMLIWQLLDAMRRLGDPTPSLCRMAICHYD